MRQTITFLAFLALTLPGLAYAQMDPGCVRLDKELPRVGWEVLTGFQDSGSVELTADAKTGVVTVEAWDTKGKMTHLGAVSFDDTGNLTLVFDWANFDDTGNLTRQVELAAFDDTGNLTMGVNHASFDDTGNLTLDFGWDAFDDTGNLTIDIDTAWKSGGSEATDDLWLWTPTK